MVVKAKDTPSKTVKSHLFSAFAVVDAHLKSSVALVDGLLVFSFLPPGFSFPFAATCLKLLLVLEALWVSYQQMASCKFECKVHIQTLLQAKPFEH